MSLEKTFCLFNLYHIHSNTYVSPLLTAIIRVSLCFTLITNIYSSYLYSSDALLPCVADYIFSYDSVTEDILDHYISLVLNVI